MTKKYFFYTILSLAVIACAAIGWYQNQKRETKQQMPLVATETKTNTSHKLRLQQNGILRFVTASLIV